MLSDADRQRACFAPNDPVEFGHLNYSLKGTIVRLNPKRAVVQVDDEQFSVLYHRLKPDSRHVEARVKKIEAIHQSAIDLLHTHGLERWQFQFDHSTRRAGCCDFRKKTISLSFNLAQSDLVEDIRDTLLHEIAHALVGRKHHHDAIWKEMALKIGCCGERTHTLQFAPPRWSVTCENHCWSHTAQQRSSRLICRTCGGQLIYSPYSLNTDSI
ncbi:MAG: SprT-like domain-containing protein [Pontiella sp.]